MRIAVIGARGQLGAAMVHELAPAHDVASFDHAALDITDARAVESAMARVRPDAIINCAGYNAVDDAEVHSVDALQANAVAVRTMTRAAVAHDATLVHCSSDFVFDGTTDRPYTEDDRANPRSVYAASKLIGEWFAADAPRAYVVRVESLFGRAPDSRPAKGSVAVILNGLRAGTAPSVFEDRTVSPTYVIDAAAAIHDMVARRVPPGLYHCVNSGHCTWLEFAIEAARLLGVEARVDAVRMADVPMRASRPKYCALSNAKLLSAGIVMPTWQDALERYLTGADAEPRGRTPAALNTRDTKDTKVKTG
jgi:dTDP-4-dehydrorhamnose reductase